MLIGEGTRKGMDNHTSGSRARVRTASHLEQVLNWLPVQKADQEVERDRRDGESHEHLDNEDWNVRLLAAGRSGRRIGGMRRMR